MNRTTICAVAITLLLCMAGVNKIVAQTKTNEKEINWLTVEEAEAKTKVNPKKIYIDVYTDWCGWCKVMDKKTFSNPSVVKFMNENYYCVRLNAEKTPTILYKGKTYKNDANSNVNPLAVEWMNGKLSYPTSLFFDEKFNIIQPLPGYLELGTFEEIVKFLNGDNYKKMPFEEYKKTLTERWK
jgi:thioredoxin-related protein